MNNRLLLIAYYELRAFKFRKLFVHHVSSLNTLLKRRRKNTYPSQTANAPKLQVDRIAIDLPEYQGTVEEVADQKCRAAWEHIQKNESDKNVRVIVEDTALC